MKYMNMRAMVLGLCAATPCRPACGTEFQRHAQHRHGHVRRRLPNSAVAGMQRRVSVGSGGYRSISLRHSAGAAHSDEKIARVQFAWSFAFGAFCIGPEIYCI